jgi:hypothetical protein
MMVEMSLGPLVSSQEQKFEWFKEFTQLWKFQICTEAFCCAYTRIFLVIWYIFVIYALTEHCGYNRSVFITETCFNFSSSGCCSSSLY